MAHNPYAPKRNPAADIVDLKPPPWMTRQDRPRTQIDRDQEHLAAVEADLAGYIDAANTETALPTETVDTLDLVAGLKLILKKLTYSEMKGVAAGLVGEKTITTAAEMADALEGFASREVAA
jgi:hypothetical protein